MRCPDYTEYFLDMSQHTDTPETYPISSGSHVCGAATKQHGQLRKRVEDRVTRRKRGSDLV